MKDGEEIRDYLKRAEKNWEEHTGNRHDSSPSMTILYIDQCQKGLPASIQEKLDDVVGLESKSEAEWKQHITHWWRSCDKKKSTEREDLDKITSILLNQQLTDKNAQQKAKTKQILVTTPAPSPTDIQLTVDTAVAKAVQQARTANAQPPATPPPPATPMVHTAPQYNDHSPMTSGNSYRDRGREGNPRGRGILTPMRCFGCGGQGHFVRDCPSNSQYAQGQGGYQPQTTPYRGGLPARGRGRGREHLQYHHQMPQSTIPDDQNQPQGY